MNRIPLLIALIIFCGTAGALEVQGFLTHDCVRHQGVIVYVNDESVEIINLQGQLEALSRNQIDTVYVFNVIDNPNESIHVDAAALKRLKAVYLEDSRNAQTLAFPVRYIEDLVLFYSLGGQSHVHTLADIYKLRPPPESALGTVRTKTFRATKFELTDQSAQCSSPTGPATASAAVKPTRILADKISISEFLHSFQQGYESIESFQERTYLYAKPFIFEKHPRLGIVFQGNREEPGIPVPIFYQWSTGEAYRFQSESSVGSKRQEVVPNAEPVFSLRSDVKSHIFHGLFVGNVAGIPAGNSIFLRQDFMKLTPDLTVQPSFNYLAMMGGDYGPYSLSVGFFFPTFGIKVGSEYREVLGSSVSYAVRLMYTVSRLKLRAIGSWSDYGSGNPTDKEVISRAGENGSLATVADFKFSSIFLRGGVDYDFSDRFGVGLDAIVVNGNYKERADDHTATPTPHLQNNNIRFNRLTIQPYVRQSFSNYVSITAYADILQNNFKSHFFGRDDSRQQQETQFFGTFEFVF